MDDPPKWSSVSPENSNFARLCKLLIDGGTHVLRMVFDKIVPPDQLQSHLKQPKNYAILKSLKEKKIVIADQWNKLYTGSGPPPTSQSFDITLLCILLRSICNLTRPSRGWDKEPLPTSISTVDDIARIKIHRNKLYGHITEPALADSEFDSYWNDIASVLERLGGKEQQEETRKLKEASMDPVDEKNYLRFFEEWCVKDSISIKELEESEKRVTQKIEENKEQLVEKVDANNHKLSEKMDEILEQFRRIQPAGERTFQDPLVYSENLKRAIKHQLEYQEGELSPIIKNKKIEDIFTNLVIKQRQTNCPNLSLNEKGGIFLGSVDDEKNPKAILIVGNPGIGKSLFCKKLVHDWTHDCIFDSTATTGHPDIKFTFLLTFRQLKSDEKFDLKKLLNLCTMLDETALVEEHVIDYIIQHPEHLLIILDGYDEYQDRRNMVGADFEKSFPNNPKSEMHVTALVSKIVKKKILRNSIVVVTSRPLEADEIKHLPFDRHVEIDGFSEEQVIEFVGKYFKSSEEMKTKALDSIKENRDYLSFGRVPLMCLLMCIYMEWHIPKSAAGECLPKTLTAFYSEVLQCIEKKHRESLDETTTSSVVQKMWDQLSEIAAMLISRRQYSFVEDDLKQLTNLTDRELSYIKSSSLLFREAGVRDGPLSQAPHKYTFTHTTMQEYFAARYFVSKNEMPARNSVSSMVLQFMAGSMNHKKHEKLMKELLDFIGDGLAEHEMADADKRVIALNCLYEYADREFTKRIVQQNHDSRYWYTNGEIYLCNIDHKPVVMLVDVITTLNQEQCLPSSSPIPFYLYIDHSTLTVPGIQSLFSSLSREFCTLTKISLYDCDIGNQGLHCCSEYLPVSRVPELILSENKISDEGLASLAQHCLNFIHFDVSHNKITNKGVASCAPYCSNLIHLNLSFNEITDEGVASLASHCINLSHLNLSGNKVTDKGILSILKGCVKIASLVLFHIDITDDGLDNLMSKLPHREQLLVLSLTGNKVSKECRKRVIEMLRDKPHIKLSI